MTDDVIVDRIAAMIRSTLINLGDDPMFFAVESTNIMDHAEAYRLAYIAVNE